MRYLKPLGRDRVSGSIIETYSLDDLILSYAVHKPYRYLIVDGNVTKDTAFDLLEHFHFDSSRPVNYRKDGNLYKYWQEV